MAFSAASPIRFWRAGTTPPPRTASPSSTDWRGSTLADVVLVEEQELFSPSTSLLRPARRGCLGHPARSMSRTSDALNSTSPPAVPPSSAAERHRRGNRQLAARNRRSRDRVPMRRADVSLRPDQPGGHCRSSETGIDVRMVYCGRIDKTAPYRRPRACLDGWSGRRRRSPTWSCMPLAAF